MTTTDRVSRLTYPTASFSLRQGNIAWLDAEAKRRGISRSELVREILDAAEAASKEVAA